MHIRIGIIDDNHHHIQELSNLFKTWAMKHHHSMEIDTFTDGNRLMVHLRSRKNHYDILFIDIELSQDSKNGIEIAKEFRNQDHEIPFVFLTSHAEYSLSGYEVRPFNFYLKPMTEKTLEQCMSTLLHYIKKDFLNIYVKNNYHKVPFMSIHYIETEKNYVTIHTGSGPILYKVTLISLLPKLPEYFIQCSRYYVVNLHSISRYMNNDLLLVNGSQIPVTKKFREAVQSSLSHR